MKPMIDVLVADSGAFLRACSLHEMAGRVVTVPEVIAEIRDNATRQRLQVLPYELEVRTPSDHHQYHVRQFALKTGDWRHLSATDVKLLALARQLTAEINGSESDIRLTPPGGDIRGSGGGGVQQVVIYHPRQRRQEERGSSLPVGFVEGGVEALRLDSGGDSVSEEGGEDGGSSASEEVGNSASEEVGNSASENGGEGEVRSIISGDEHGDLESSNHVNDSRGDVLNNTAQQQLESERGKFLLSERQDAAVYKQQQEQQEETGNASSGYVEDREKERGSRSCDQVQEPDQHEEDRPEVEEDAGWITPENLAASRMKMLEQSGLETVPLKVACLTTDFTIQNVLKQMGLEIVSVDGRRIREARRFILRCFGCFQITPRVDTVFCPSCGHKTLKRVAVTVNDDGTRVIHISSRRPISTRGTIFSVPKHRGGKFAINPIVTADQKIPQQRISKKAQARNAILTDDYVCGDSPFAIRDVTSRSAQLGLTNRAASRHWQRRNPNSAAPSTGNRRKRRR